MNMATDKTPLILPRLISRDVSSDNGLGVIKRTSNTKYVAPFTIVVALERFTYYSLVVNLLLFLNDDVYMYVNETKGGAFAGGVDIIAVVSVMILVGLSWLFCVLGGWLSDAKLGKLKTIIWGLVMYTLGTGLLLLTAYIIKKPKFQTKRLYRVLIAFGSLLIALMGEGAYKANIAAFGAEQLDHKDPISTRRYFNFYYFSLNIGSLFALSISAYVQQSHGFGPGFALPFGSITLALIIFVLSRKQYKTLPCQRMVGKVYRIIKEARKNSKRNNQSSPPQHSLYWLDHARMKYGGSFLDWEVDEAKFLFAIIPVFIVLLPYQTIYNQMNATFLQQGIHMNLGLGLQNFDTFPAAWLFFFNAVIVVILLPIMDRFVYPWLTKRGYAMIPLTRISIGILVGCFAIIAAGFVDIYVVQDFVKNNTVTNHNVNHHNVTAAKLSVFYQIPQYLLIGVSEIFANVGGLELAYRNAPRSMQGVVMSLFFATISFGSLLGSGLLGLSLASNLINHKTKGPNSRKYYDLTYYFFLLGALMLISWIVFIIYVERNRRKRSKERARTRMFNRTRAGGLNSSDISSVADLPTDNYYNDS